ncbi:class I SAM-dependent methyltransferase [Psychrilyobacter atlanticus]|uniref:class I SAM-dependent methyltransferase n=1 Tax=Psychrilyobacter atlanticus TaxID=271091 RepID=UPI000424DA2D|nr:methyltransferase domain-containing protein [Psychrilyobacter atlanticus]
MTYFNDRQKVQEYIEMCEDMDGKKLIDVLKKHLKEKSTILELGMGPGKDLNILKKYYNAIGSDNSQEFLNVYAENNKDTQLLLLDAVTINTEKKFDCIYSNKVLQHLTKNQLNQSAARQWEVLYDDGLLFHTFWRGDLEEIYNGLRFVYYEKDELINLFQNLFNIIEIDYYSEEEDKDSIYIILQKK